MVYITVDGKVKGEVRSPDVIINGHVQGDVFASGQLVLASNAIVDGNVHYNLIEMEKGATINGNMHHISGSMPASRGGTAKSTKTKTKEPIEQAELSAS